MPQKRRVPPILWTILCILLLFSLAVTPAKYKSAVNMFFISLRLIMIFLFGAFGIRGWWNYWHHGAAADSADRLLRRFRRWMLGEGDATPERKD